MSTLTADDTMQAILASCKGLTEIRDGHGGSLGYFLPPMSREELLLYLKVLGEFDPEEIKRREEQERGQGRTLQDVLARLKALGTS